MNIRKANTGDAEHVSKLLIENWLLSLGEFIPKKDLQEYHNMTYNTAKLQELIKNKANECIVVEDDDVLCAWLMLKEDRPFAKIYLSSLYVSGSHQGKGIGNELINRAFNTAKKKGFQEIHIGVFSENVRALKLYEKLGFDFYSEEEFKMGNTIAMHRIGKKKLV